MTDVQLENGYTRIANELLEAIYSTNFNATQLKIILFIIRYTYGFNRKNYSISITFLSKQTGISKRYISEELNRLIESKVIIIIQEYSVTTSRILSINKNYDEWTGYRTILQQVNNTSTGIEEQFNTGIEEQFNTGIEEQFNTTDEEYFHHIKKEIKLIEKPPKKVFNNDDKEYKLAKYLSRSMAERLNKPMQNEKTLQSWASDFNKMIRLDKYDIEEMKDVLIYSQENEFWKKNILSASKFRKQYITLLAQMKG